MRRCLNCMSEYPDQYEDCCPRCGYVHGTTQSGSTDLAPGSILQGRYIVGTVIRSRDTDVFYNGWDALFDRRVILQEYYPKYCAARSGGNVLSIYDSKTDVYQEGLQLFYQQSRELIRFYKEPDIITYHACFQENRTAYAVMEHRNYETLREWLKRNSVSSREAMEILLQAVEITEKCHAAGMLHGMINLDSLWMTGENRLVLKDFGPWRYISGEPGVVSYRNANASTDVYRLAVLFCQILTGALTEDPDKLLSELNRNRIQLRGHEMKALKNALSHDTADLGTFREELTGELGGAAYASGSSQSARRARRRDARHSLSLPKWTWAAAGILILLAVIFTVIRVSGIELKSDEGELEKQEVRVPNVVGKDADDIETVLRTMGLRLERKEMNYSDEIAEGMISHQDPASGVVLKKGDSVVVSISKGKEKAEIPLVEGLDEETAKKMFEEAGFSNVTVEELPESPQKYGTVLAVKIAGTQNEKPKELTSIIGQLLSGKLHGESQKKEDRLAPLDAAITMLVSRKKLQPDEIEVTIPELVGINLKEAQDILEKISEKEMILQPQEEYSDKPEGEIISQIPASGEKTTESHVQVVVSKGKEKMLVPNVYLMTREAAEKELKAQGLKAGTVSEAYHDSVPKGQVISQSIEAEELTDKDAAVNLVISKGVKPASKKETKPQPKPNPTKAPKPVPTTSAPAETSAAILEETTVESSAEQITEAAAETSKSDDKNAIVAGTSAASAETKPAPSEISASASTEAKPTSAETSAAMQTEAKPTSPETSAAAETSPAIVIDPNPLPTEKPVQPGVGPGGV